MILVELEREPARSIEALASRLGKLRPSVSRSLKLLQAEGLVVRERQVWRLTPEGGAEAQEARRLVRETAAGVQQAIAQAMVPASEAARAAALIVRTSHMQDAFKAINRWNSMQLAAVALPDIGRVMEQFDSSAVVSLQRTLREAAGIGGALQALNTSHTEALTRAITPLLDTQSHHAAFMAQIAESVRAPMLESVYRAVNLSLSSSIEDGFAMRGLERLRLPSIMLQDLNAFPPLDVHFPAITASLEQLLTRPIGNPGDTRAAAGAGWVQLAAPPMATAAYSRSLRHFLEEDPAVSSSVAYPTDDHRDELTSRLTRLGPGFVEKYHGMWSALEGGGPDHLRHAASSGRELIRTVLQYFVPDAELDDDERSSLIKPRVKRLLDGSDSGATWVSHMMLGMVAYYGIFNAYAHEDRDDLESLRAMLIAADGVLLFLLVNAQRHRE